MIRLEFTPRETCIIEHLELGLTHKEIGFSLGISPRTVGSHIQKMFNKHNARNVTHLVHKFYQIKNKKG